MRKILFSLVFLAALPAFVINDKVYDTVSPDDQSFVQLLK